MIACYIRIIYILIGIDVNVKSSAPHKCKRKIASTLTFLGGCFAATDI